ncbi:hypothetical protein PROFUN_04476 [Planoprotostelium fungivorum]|uniref:Uncharacterized protein n=1 Tax=Planoprotostelium fungivorum TaxID=1890364 RepID=A0A2P6NW01_9EUKA|nr:hypothetical protein PROFUN_04476 [Planoprotostelium fungivorum]
MKAVVLHTLLQNNKYWKTLLSQEEDKILHILALKHLEQVIPLIMRNNLLQKQLISSKLLQESNCNYVFTFLQ